MKTKTVEKKYRTVDRIWCNRRQLMGLYFVWTPPEPGKELITAGIKHVRARITEQGGMYLVEEQEERK